MENADLYLCMLQELDSAEVRGKDYMRREYRTDLRKLIK